MANDTIFFILLSIIYCFFADNVRFSDLMSYIDFHKWKSVQSYGFFIIYANFRDEKMQFTFIFYDSYGI